MNQFTTENIWQEGEGKKNSSWCRFGLKMANYLTVAFIHAYENPYKQIHRNKQ